MAPYVESPDASSVVNPTILSLRKSLCAEDSPLPVRFRALFSLKHLATNSADQDALAAIDAIAAAFSSPSALLKHELAYCLGQTGNKASTPYLRQVLEDLEEDTMCRHEAAEALGALGDAENLDILKQYRDREGEHVAVKETCEIAIDRLEWENSEQRKQEKLRQRYETPLQTWAKVRPEVDIFVQLLVISHPSTLRPQCPNPREQWRTWARP